MVPKVLLPPATPLTSQLTLVMLVLVTVAVNACCVPVVIAIDCGETVIATADSDPKPLIVAGLAPPQLANTSTRADHAAMQKQRHILLPTKNSNHRFEISIQRPSPSDVNRGQIRQL
jgi:hypothetical protein